MEKKYRKEFGLENKFVVGCVGRFAYQKNYEFLAEIFSEIRKKNKNIIYFWKNIFELIPAVGISIVIAYICKKYIIVNNIGSFLIVGIIYVTVYAVCMFSFGMNKYEKELVKKPIKRLLRKR